MPPHRDGTPRPPWPHRSPALRKPDDVAVVGAGPAGLMAAERLSRGGTRVTVYDRMPSAGRKFLLAGRGGLNLTHSEDLATLQSRYGAAAPRLGRALASFSPADLRTWSEGLGQPTFVGTSGRVFPESFKASPLLRAWLRRLDAAGVAFRPRHRWTGWDARGALTFETPEGARSTDADATVLALGGASWPQLGSDGLWTGTLVRDGVAISPLKPANCGFAVPWSAPFRDRFEGHPLKGIRLCAAGATSRGEALVTRDGLEGGGLYALSAPLRDSIASDGVATLRVDLKPDLERPAIAARLARARTPKASLATALRKAVNLAPVAIGLLQEAAHAAGVRLGAMGDAALAEFLRDVPVTLVGAAPIAGAISTAGGVTFEDVDERLMLRRRPGTFLAGEMLDWEAPTGGYLLQACFSTGATAGDGALAWLAEHSERS